MSGRGDYDDEMLWNRSISDREVEDLLAGVDDDPAFTAFLADARDAAGGPVPAPSEVLAAMLGSGTAVASVTPIESLTPRRRRMPVPAGLAALPLAAKVALGIGVAAAATTGAGVAGVLPAPAQHAVESVVETVTPFSIDHPDRPAQSTFGTDVSTDARDETPGVDGAQVSADARSNGAVNGGGAAPTPPVPPSLPTPPVPAPPVTTPPVPAPPVTAPPATTPPVGGVPTTLPPVPAPPVSTPGR